MGISVPDCRDAVTKRNPTSVNKGYKRFWPLFRRVAQVNVTSRKSAVVKWDTDEGMVKDHGRSLALSVVVPEITHFSPDQGQAVARPLGGHTRCPWNNDQQSGTILDVSPRPIFVQNGIVRADNVSQRRRQAAALWREMIVGPFGGRADGHADGRVFARRWIRPSGSLHIWEQFEVPESTRTSRRIGRELVPCFLPV